MRTLFYSILFLLVISSCGGDERLDSKFKDVKIKDLVKDGVITQDQRLDLLAYSYSNFYNDKDAANKLESEKSVSEMLSLSIDYKNKIFNDETKKDEQKIFLYYRARTEIRDLIGVELVDAWIKPYSDIFWKAKLRLINKSSNFIKGVKGALVVYDTFGDVITGFEFQTDDNMNPSDTIYVNSDYALVEQKYISTLRKGLKDKDYKNLDPTFFPTKLLLTDGTSIEAEWDID